jgi:hypothetical protein
MRRVLIAADLLLIFLFLSFFLSFIKKSIPILQRKDQPSSSSKTACHTSSISFAVAASAVRKEAAIW